MKHNGVRQIRLLNGYSLVRIFNKNLRELKQISNIKLMCPKSAKMVSDASRRSTKLGLVMHQIFKE